MIQIYVARYLSRIKYVAMHASYRLGWEARRGAAGRRFRGAETRELLTGRAANSGNGQKRDGGRGRTKSEASDSRAVGEATRTGSGTCYAARPANPAATQAPANIPYVFYNPRECQSTYITSNSMG